MHSQSNPQDQLLRDAIPVWPISRPADVPAYDAAWFEAVFLAVDRLHDALCSGSPDAVSHLAPQEIAGWLEDIAYTVQETILEIRAMYPGENVTAAG